mmetsp:Transcript_12125/g.26834  ORF Transcript_12125/g.26834 Transcript_12125/m.26834 type:complete len:309 (-) Transcript_12125:1297-2223(-)
MGQRQCPNTQIRCGMGHGSQHKLNRLNDLMNKDLTELKFLAMPVVVGGVFLNSHKSTFTSLLGLIVLVQQDQWLGQEHDGHSAHRVHHQSLRQLHRAVPEGKQVLLTHGHTNQGVDDAGRIVNRMHPLVEDHHIHPSKEAKHENHHGNALTKEVRHVLLVECIAPPQKNAHGHLQHSKEDGELHLQRVHIQQLVVGAMPRPVETEGVWTTTTRILHIIIWFVVSSAHFLPSAIEELKTNGEEVIVHEPRIDGKETKAHHHVAHHEEGRLSEAQGLSVFAQPKTRQEEQRAVAHVAIHHAEDEWEGHHR